MKGNSNRECLELQIGIGVNHKMGFHLPSFLVGSSIAGIGFLLIHRELSHRHRLTTKWALQEYAEKEWKQWREGNLDSISDVAKVRRMYR